MTRPDTLSRFVSAVELALVLPHPTAIYRAILANTEAVHDGLKGTAYDGDRTSGGTASSHPERELARKHPGQFPADDAEDQRGTWGARTDRAKDDLLHLRRATDRVFDSIAALNAECCDAGTPDDWDDALKCAHILHETGMLQAAIDVGRDVDSWALRFVHAVDSVRAIRDSWMAHAPGEGVAEDNQAWCRPCLRLGIKRKRITKACCQRCWRDVLDLEGSITDDDGQIIPAVELQLMPRYWPTEEMGRAREDGRTVLFGKEQQAWHRSLGVDPNVAHQRRQQRRTG